MPIRFTLWDCGSFCEEPASRACLDAGLPHPGRPQRRIAIAVDMFMNHVGQICGGARCPSILVSPMSGQTPVIAQALHGRFF